MQRVRAGLGVLAGVLLLLSAAAHSLAGWPAMVQRLRGVNAPADLIAGLAMGWQFSGASMLVFGVLMLALFIERWRGTRVAAWPAALVGAMYLAFTLWTTLTNGWDAFYLVFAVPGALLLIAAL